MRPLKFNNATERKFVAVKQDNVLEILCYDLIGEGFFFEGVTAKGIAAQIEDAGEIDAINLRLNSPGGDVMEALTVKNLLESKNIPVNVFIDGEAASAATILMLAGDTITMGEGTTLFIHNAWTSTSGNANDLRKMADDLEKVSGEMRKLYATRTGLPEAEIQSIMDKETLLTAEEAVAKRFADAIATPAKASAVKVGTLAVKVEVDTSELKEALDLVKQINASEPDQAPAALSRTQLEHELTIL